MCAAWFKVPVYALLLIGADSAGHWLWPHCVLGWQPCSRVLAHASAAVPALIFGVLSHVLARAVQSGLRYLSGRWSFESFEGVVKYLTQASILVRGTHECYWLQSRDVKGEILGL